MNRKCKSRSAARKEEDMTLEDFKEVYEDATPEKLLRLLVDALDHKANERVEYMKTENPEVKEWCAGEVKAMDERAEWIWGKLMDFIKGPYGREPKKPQLFTGLWAAKHPGGLVYKRDIAHALGNSDQYPFSLWEKDYMHLAAQEAQTETLQAVTAAIDRCPVYEDQQDPDSVSRFSLLTYLMGKKERYGEEYRTEDMLLDIQQFGITRKRMEET